MQLAPACKSGAVSCQRKGHATACNALVLMLLTLFLSRATAETEVVELTEENFNGKISDGSEWMVEIYAPWCSHCQQLEPTWRRLASELTGRVLVGKINGDQQQGLAQRFGIIGYPSICHLRQGQTREYTGDRSLQDLKQYAEGGWRRTKPNPFYRAPNSPMGLALGRVLAIPSKIAGLHQYLRNVKHVPDLILLAGFLAVPVIIGMALICLLDAWYTQRPPDWAAFSADHAQHPHAE